MDASLLIKLILGSAAAVAAAPFDLAAAEAAETAGVHEQHIANLINGAADDANNHRRLQSEPPWLLRAPSVLLQRAVHGVLVR